MTRDRRKLEEERVMEGQVSLKGREEDDPWSAAR